MCGRPYLMHDCDHYIYTYRWSDYTLYRLEMDQRKLFHHHHSPISGSLVDKHGDAQQHQQHQQQQQQQRLPHLICPTSVWTADALPWDHHDSFTANCLFVVLQSTANIQAGDIAKALETYV